MARAKNSTAGGLDGWAWNEIEALPLPWFSGLAMAGMVRIDSYALGSDMSKAGFAGGHAFRAVFAEMRGRLFLGPCTQAQGRGSCPQGHGSHN